MKKLIKPKNFKKKRKREKEKKGTDLFLRNKINPPPFRRMFYRSNTPVGYNNGDLTHWVRIELTKAGEPVIHSFPASPEQVQKHMGKIK